MTHANLSNVIKNALPLIERFSIIADPRIDRHRVYPLKNILFFTFAATLADQQSWYQIVEFCESQLNWFEEFLDVAAGVPSHDTFRRVFSLLRPETLEKFLVDWVESLREECGSNERVIAIDGKACRGVPWKLCQDELHTLNAFEPGTSLCLGQVGVNSKSNEITAMPKLLEMLNLKNAVVTVDALLTQKSIVQQVRGANAHYFFALKRNHLTFYEEAKLYFGVEHEGQEACQSIEKNRGYVEERTCVVSGDTKGWETLDEWADLVRVVKITLKRTRDGKTSEDQRFFITSAKRDAESYLAISRSHWSVENLLHRTLDVLFLEDSSQVHERTIASNLSVMRKLAINVLRQIDPGKTLISKRKRAAYDSGFRRAAILGKL